MSVARIKTQVLRWVAEAFPALVYGFPRTYVVSSVASDGRLELVPPPDAQHLPELKVQQWTVGITRPKAGDEVTIAFRDANPSRPVVTGWEFAAPPSKITFDADELELGAGATDGVARLGDTVSVLLTPAVFTGTINGLPASGLVTFTPPQTTGTISTASSKVRAVP